MFLYPDPEGRARAKADYEREYAEAVAAKDTPLFTAELLPGWRLEACGEEGRKATFYILHEL